MFSSSSSQMRNWTFDSLDEIKLLRDETNSQACEKYRERTGASSDFDCLSVDEELCLLHHYQQILETLCDKTEPPVPRHTRAVALTYVRRFYLHNSVIDFFPREVMLTAIWIAMKTEEFNLSLAEFGRCIPRNASKYMEIIRASELFLIERLNYDLLVHVPTRTVDGLVFEWRTYLAGVLRASRSEHSNNSDDVSMHGDSEELNERICADAIEMVYRSVHTDAIFVLSPSQIALGALHACVENCGDALLISRFADFVLERMCDDRNDIYDQLISKIALLDEILKSVKVLVAGESAAVEDKLDNCRNPQFNFDSEIYKAKKRKWIERYEQL